MLTWIQYLTDVVIARVDDEAIGIGGGVIELGGIGDAGCIAASDGERLKEEMDAAAVVADPKGRTATDSRKATVGLAGLRGAAVVSVFVRIEWMEAFVEQVSGPADFAGEVVAGTGMRSAELPLRIDDVRSSVAGCGSSIHQWPSEVTGEVEMWGLELPVVEAAGEESRLGSREACSNAPAAPFACTCLAGSRSC